MGLKKLFGSFGKDKKYLSMTAEELVALDNVELRDAISAIMMNEAGRKQVVQCLNTFSGPKRIFYIVSLYEAEVSTGGLARFLVGPGRSAAGCIMAALKEVHATRHAELLRKFTTDNKIDLQDLGDLRIDSSWEFDDVKKQYPFDQFNEKFADLYERESIDGRLMQYVRNNIDQFV